MDVEKQIGDKSIGLENQLEESLLTLKDFNWSITIDTSSADIMQDFFIPALSRAIRYDRAVGFFSSGWLRVAAEGMIQFAANGGKARWVTSPVFSEDDWSALQVGEAARQDQSLYRLLCDKVDLLTRTLEREPLSALSWMIADEILEFKIAIPKVKLEQGNFHAKFGVFTDAEENKLSFNGSYNDSIQGTLNYESIKVFRSWDSSLVEAVQDDVKRFEILWCGKDPNVAIYDLPTAVREKIVQLRSTERPYIMPAWVKDTPQIQAISLIQPSTPSVPGSLQLRDYQLQAIEAWFDNGCRGFFEMATGTGKTITALAASVRLYERAKKIAIIVAVPYQHLVDQWDEEAQAFGYRPVLAYQSKAIWLDKLQEKISNYNNGYHPVVSVIVTHTTFCDEDFQAVLAKLRGASLLIADETHHLGAESSRKHLPDTIPFRLALSATPDRWYDEEGTIELRNYFGNTVFEFPLEKAIGVSLTPYMYYPHLVPLTDEELESYQELSSRIAPLMERKDQRSQDNLKLLLIRRAQLLNQAENKLKIVSELVDQNPDMHHTLFYCAPGQHKEVLKMLGWDKGFIVHGFTADEDARTRKRLLEDFAKGDLQVLVAMKCLDEGVDVPSTQTAFILASSSNPREFIQRRGRILRKAPGKEFAVIYDMIAVPPDTWTVSQDSPTFQSERSIIRRELQRFKEFAGSALNKQQALDIVWDIAKRYSLLDF